MKRTNCVLLDLKLVSNEEKTNKDESYCRITSNTVPKVFALERFMKRPFSPIH